MCLRVLGCSGGIGAGQRTTAFLVDDDILIDAGTGVCDLTLDEMQRLRHIFVTHSHLDHVVSIPMLIDSLFGLLPAPLKIHGLPATIEAIREHLFNWTIWPDFSRLPEPDSAVLDFVPMEPGDAIDLDGRQIQMVPVHHAVPAAGYVCTAPAGGRFCFSGDTGANDVFWDALNDLDALDLMIVETAFPDDHARLAELACHYTPATLARDIGRLRHRPTVAITHRKVGLEQRIMDEVETALAGWKVCALQRGDTFEI